MTEVWVSVGINIVTEVMTVYSVDPTKEEAIASAKKQTKDDFLHAIRMDAHDFKEEGRKMMQWLRDHGLPSEHAKQVTMDFLEDFIRRGRENAIN